MDTRTDTIDVITITASPGKLLTNGIIYAQAVTLPATADISVWREIDESEAPSDGEGDPSVVRYSKYKIQLACQKRMLWERVKDAIADANLQDSWANIIDIRSDNPELQAALPDIEAVFGSETVAAVLAESVAE